MWYYITCMKINTLKTGFTLAETLMTLVIIGVIAALTIPSLINSINDIAYVTALKKNYSVISNAFNLVNKFEGNMYEDWEHQDGNQDVLYQNYTYLKKYLHVIRECNNKAGCWSKDLTQKPGGGAAEGASEIGMGGDIIAFSLNDGTNVCLDYWSQSDIINKFGVNKNLMSAPLSVWVDVNGDRKPNKLGKDVFAFVLTSQGIVPAGINNNSAHCKSTGYDCAAKYLIKTAE